MEILAHRDQIGGPQHMVFYCMPRRVFNALSRYNTKKLIHTRGVTRDFPGNKMSFHWNYSTKFKNSGNCTSYNCAQWLRGFKNCINHFSSCPQCREHTWNATIFGIITPRWKIREIAYPMIGPTWVEDSKTVSITFLGAPSTENTPEIRQYFELFCLFIYLVPKLPSVVLVVLI